MTYSFLDDDDTIEDEVPSPFSVSQMQNYTHDPHELSSKHNLEANIHLEEEEEEDFQTVSLDDEHWTTEEIPDRPLCIHDHLLPHRLCPYQCPYANYQTPSNYKTTDLSDISEFEDLMTTSSDEDIPALEDSTY